MEMRIFFSGRREVGREKKKHLISQLIFRFKLPGPLVASGDFLWPSAGSVQRDTPCTEQQSCIIVLYADEITFPNSYFQLDRLLVDIFSFFFASFSYFSTPK